MAERIVSPGVFTRERDLSFLPAGIAQIGAAIIGPTIKGPAFVPTMISNFSEFEEMFGSTTKDFYTPYAVEQYLRSAGTVTIVRVLNTGGYSADFVQVNITGSLGAASAVGVAQKTMAVLAPSRGGSDGTVRLDKVSVSAHSAVGTGDYTNFTLSISGSNFGAKSVNAYSASVSFNTSSADYIDVSLSEDPQVTKSGISTVPAYLYKNFKFAQSNLPSTYTTDLTNTTASLASGSYNAVDFTSAAYANASSIGLSSASTWMTLF